jgi:hypothetical protein
MLLASVDLGCSEEVRCLSHHFPHKQRSHAALIQVLTVVAMLSGDGGKVLYPQRSTHSFWLSIV